MAVFDHNRTGLKCHSIGGVRNVTLCVDVKQLADGRIDSPAMANDTAPRPAAASPRSLSGLLPFIRPYRGVVFLGGLFLVLAAASTLAFPVALKTLIDQGLVATEPGARVMQLRGHFVALFGVAMALGLF